MVRFDGRTSEVSTKVNDQRKDDEHDEAVHGGACQPARDRRFILGHSADNFLANGVRCRPCSRNSRAAPERVQHMIESMATKSGRMAVVLPHGALFRMGAEGKIRQKLLGMDILDAVIGLGQNLFYGTGLAACILVFRQKKPQRHRKKVLIVDAS